MFRFVGAMLALITISLSGGSVVAQSQIATDTDGNLYYAYDYNNDGLPDYYVQATVGASGVALSSQSNSIAFNVGVVEVSIGTGGVGECSCPAPKGATIVASNCGYKGHCASNYCQYVMGNFPCSPEGKGSFCGCLRINPDGHKFFHSASEITELGCSGPPDDPSTYVLYYKNRRGDATPISVARLWCQNPDDQSLCSKLANVAPASKGNCVCHCMINRRYCSSLHTS